MQHLKRATQPVSGGQAAEGGLTRDAAGSVNKLLTTRSWNPALRVGVVPARLYGRTLDAVSLQEAY